jgi:hypothetical protein
VIEEIRTDKSRILSGGARRGSGGELAVAVILLSVAIGLLILLVRA